MTTTTPKDIALMLAQDAEGVAAMLLPNGKRVGHEWRAGDVHGADGKSLGVHLSGNKAGVWSDFAAGQSGDLLDLWAAARGLSIGEAISQARDYLGIESPRFAREEKQYSKPQRPQCTTPKASVMQWLQQDRNLSPEAIAAYRLAEDGDFVVFPYLRNGELLRWKRRHKDDKHNCQTSSNSEPCLFGWHAIPSTARSVTICEGEIDAVAWWQMGYPALSVPSGAKSLTWIECEYENLSRFDVIYLAMDADGPGQDAVPKIVERLGIERVMVVSTSPHKDANDLLRVAPESAPQIIQAARTLDPDELKPVEHYRSKVVDIFTGQAAEIAGHPTPWAKVGDRFRFRSSEVTVLAGENFSGKSEVCGQFAVDMMARGERACVASMEFNPEGWIARIMQQVALIPSGSATKEFANAVVDWLCDRLWVFGVVGSSKRERILEVFAYARRRYGIWLFVIDNLQKCGLADDDYNGQKQFVDQLTDFAKTHRCHVILVHHLNKSEDDKPGTSYRVKGSGGITDMADNVVIWWRNRGKEREIEALAGSGAEIGEDTLTKPDAMFVVEKQRNGGDTPKALLWFDKRSHQFIGARGGRPTQYFDTSAFASLNSNTAGNEGVSW